MSEIISHRRRVQESSLSWDFKYSKDPGAGWSFPVDKDGSLTNLTDSILDNFIIAIEGSNHLIPTSNKYHENLNSLIDIGIREHKSWHTEYAQLKCDCGEIVELTSFTNTCDKCGADYNTSGQRLAPRSQWGEETGESAVDILNYDYKTCPPVDY